MRLISILAAASATVTLGASAHATQFVQNGNFTQGVGANGGTTATDWTSAGYNFFMTNANTPVGGVDGFKLWDKANYVAGSSGFLGKVGSTSVYANPVGNSWNGKAAGTGNFVAIDGDYKTGPISQVITGLTVGQQYDLTFEYAFAQQKGDSGDTEQYLTETLGGQTFTSSTVDVPSHGFSGWEKFSETITATATSETLSFLATGNLPVPPFALVSSVSLTSPAPEPSTWAMMILGVGTIGAIARRRRSLSALAA